MLVRYFLIPIILISLLFSVASCSSTSLKVLPTEDLTGFEKDMDEIRVDLKIPGMSACIIKDKEIVWSKGFGFADINAQTPVTKDTSFHIASLTKTFASIITMQLVETGELDLRAPITEFGIDWESVQVIHLLTHTAQSEPPGAKYMSIVVIALPKWIR